MGVVVELLIVVTRMDHETHSGAFSFEGYGRTQPEEAFVGGDEHASLKDDSGSGIGSETQPSRHRRAAMGMFADGLGRQVQQALDASRSSEVVLGPVEGADAITRRKPPPDSAGLSVDLEQHEVRWRAQRLPLSETEVQILGALTECPKRVWSFAELTARAWTAPYFGDSTCVRAAVKRLRHKLSDHGVTMTIEAARGVGFRLVA